MLYVFGDQRVRTSVHLNTLPTLGDDQADAIALDACEPQPFLPPVRHWLHTWRQADGAIALSVAHHGSTYLLRFPALCDVLFDPDMQTVRMTPVVGVDEATLEHLLVDQVLPRVLAHSGALAIHASALTIGDRTVLFVGDSGWGKSTLAALLGRDGHGLLSDDCVLLRVDTGAVTALPTYASLRLFDDVVQYAFPDAPGSAVARYSDKRRFEVPAAGGSLEGRPVAAIYLLREPSDQSLRHDIVAVSPATACIELMRMAFKLDLDDRSRVAALLQQAGNVARVVPAFALSYPHDLSMSGVLTNRITRHVESLRHRVPMQVAGESCTA